MTPLWTPSPASIERSRMQQLSLRAAEVAGRSFDSYADLHRWSTEHFSEFWRLWLDESGIIYEGEPDVGVPAGPSAHIEPGLRFFPQVKLSFAENLLRFSDERVAIVSLSESRPRLELTYAQLRAQVAQLQSHLQQLGIGPGDRVAGVLPNAAEAIVAMLAAVSLGAVWTSCSPDFGAQGVLDRFGQVQPRLLFASNAYLYNGKRFDCLAKVADIVRGLPSLQQVVVIPFVPDHPVALPASTVPQVSWSELTVGTAPPLALPRFPFAQPLYIMYSSGTTGVPKCIVHGAGGTLLQHSKELMLHSDLRRDDNITYFTTCGWMMWNWLVSALFVGSQVTVYDGSPSHPSLESLWRLADKEGITHFGTSAKFIGSCRDKIEPQSFAELAQLRVVLSTGSPLLPEDFDWIYAKVKSDVQLASICGGTDIISCFMLGSPTLPVYRGEIQCLGLGMDVAAFDEAGKPVVGQKGELVCRKPFPSMPVSFWNDPDSSKYRKAYFERFFGVWTHGDYIELTGTQGSAGGIIVYGRSDATLNPGGVRIGTAEIYRLVETLPEVEDSIVVGQPYDGDVRIILFVKLAPGQTLDDRLTGKLQSTVRQGATPRHVPKLVIPVDKIPYTMSGKKTELAVLEIIQGKEPKNKEALKDASALDCYRNIEAVRQ